MVGASTMIGPGWLAVGGGVLVGGCALDRFLLWAEERQWINYRKHGFSRGAAQYHMLELSAIFDPGKQQVLEMEFTERKEEDDSGAPPGLTDQDPSPSPGIDPDDTQPTDGPA